MRMHALLLTLLLLLPLPAPAHSANNDDSCAQTFYRHKDVQCIATVIKSLNSKGIADDSGTINPTLIGFFAHIFASDPTMTSVILDKTASMTTAPLFVSALHTAGMAQQADAYAKKSGQQDFLARLQQQKTPPLQDLQPRDNPADNDILIGAYMASGQADYITKMLANFADAPPQMVADAARLSLAQGKFGPSFAPKDRDSDIITFACARYECRDNRADFTRLMTLSSALWATTSLSKNDATLRTLLTAIIDSNPVLKDSLRLERVAFSNYMTSLVLLAGFPDNTDASKLVRDFESLKPAAMLTTPPMRDSTAP